MREMTHFKLKYGKGYVEFDLPKERVLNVVEGAPYPALDDLNGVILRIM